MYNYLKSRFIYAKSDYSIESLEDIEKCIYKDISKGTVYSGAQGRIIRLKKSHFNIYNWLANEIYEYLNDNKKETKKTFDEWHFKICNEFIRKCSEFNVVSKYGMAQKFVNLTLKYVYCFKDSNKIDSSKFKYCHFILDGITYFSTLPKGKYLSKKDYNGYEINTPFYSTQIIKSKKKTNGESLTPWSKLDYEEYKIIQDNVNKYFEKYPFKYKYVKGLDINNSANKDDEYELTPFEIEFFVW